MIRYAKMPSLQQWKKKDSNIKDFRVVRSRDKALLGIDAIVTAIGQTKESGKRDYLIIELYFATNYWLRNFKNKRTSMHAGREDAVRALCRYTIEQMAKGFKCGIQAVPTKLERFYGRKMTVHGHKQDTDNPGHYISRANVEQYKLIFDGGLAYTFDWENKRIGDQFVLAIADTQHIYNQDKDQGTLKEEFSRFAMSMSRDIYLAPHSSYDMVPKLKKHGIIAPAVHSSYLSGEAVLCSGSICITQGVVTDIRSDSGHYQPQYQHLMNVIRHMAVVGQNLDKIEILDYLGWPLGTATEFIDNNEHWRKRIDNVGIKYRLTKDVDALVSDRVAKLKDSWYFERLGMSKPSEDKVWRIAYRSVCEDLAVALNDPSWSKHAEKDVVIPRRKAPQPPKRKPPRPSTPHPGKFARV